jgi:predicted adenine nucleotide alpha hydrolase (AANH) superfamily ATPase
MNQKNWPKVNYQKKTDEVIRSLTADGAVPKLLLHSCCAPCSSYVLEYLSRYFELTVFYYNPNIFPAEEYEKRADELERLVSEMPFEHPVHVIRGSYEPERYYEAAKGLEEEKEGGARCVKCFELRLNEAARTAKEMGIPIFTTTLTISPLKNAELLNDIGEAAAARQGISFLPSDFKKRNGYLRSIELSKEYHLYRQNFCGCIYSKNEAKKREEERQSNQ